MVGEEDFEEAEGGEARGGDASPEPAARPPASPAARTAIYLNRRGRGIFFREFADRLETQTMHPLTGRRLSYRKIFEVQARLVAKVISGELPEYRPFLWR
jgi:hypothetical protein